jgi:hypothetical protein
MPSPPRVVEWGINFEKMLERADAIAGRRRRACVAEMEAAEARRLWAVCEGCAFGFWWWL